MCFLVATIFTTLRTFLIQFPCQHLSSPIWQIISPNISPFYLTPQFDPLFMRFLAPICKTCSASLRTLPHQFLKMPCVLCASCLLHSRLFALAHSCLVNFKTLKSATFEALKLCKSQFECKGTQNLQFWTDFVLFRSLAQFPVAFPLLTNLYKFILSHYHHFRLFKGGLDFFYWISDFFKKNNFKRSLRVLQSPYGGVAR